MLTTDGPAVICFILSDDQDPPLSKPPDQVKMHAMRQHHAVVCHKGLACAKEIPQAVARAIHAAGAESRGLAHRAASAFLEHSNVGVGLSCGRFCLLELGSERLRHISVFGKAVNAAMRAALHANESELGLAMDVSAALRLGLSSDSSSLAVSDADDSILLAGSDVIDSLDASSTSIAAIDGAEQIQKRVWFQRAMGARLAPYISPLSSILWPPSLDKADARGWRLQHAVIVFVGVEMEQPGDQAWQALVEEQNVERRDKQRKKFLEKVTFEIDTFFSKATV